MVNKSKKIDSGNTNKRELRKRKKYTLYGKIVYFILRSLNFTFRTTYVKNEKFEYGENYIYGFWHNRLVAATVCLHDTPMGVVLVSSSNDGQLIATALDKYGFEVIRGSSGRAGVQSVLKFIKKIKEGYDAGTPMDGPKGPIYKAKPGMVYLAQKSGRPMVTVGCAYDKYWTFNTWDKFMVPKPFSRVSCYVSEPIEVPEDADLDEYALIIADKIDESNRIAESLLQDNKAAAKNNRKSKKK